MKNVQVQSPAAYESKSNGGIEVGIKIVRGLFRTLKLCLEQRLGKYISTDHALVPWLLLVVNRISRRHASLTGYA